MECVSRNSTEFKEFRAKILNLDGSIKYEYKYRGGYVKFASDYMNGDTYRAYQEVSSALGETVFKQLEWYSYIREKVFWFREESAYQ